LRAREARVGAGRDGVTGRTGGIWCRPVIRAALSGDYLAHYIGEIARHPAAAPTSFAGLISSTGSPFEQTFRGGLAHITWPGVSERFRSDIAALEKVPAASGGDSWKAINQAATRATLDLTSAAAQ
jgi:hypothetical protein